MLHPASHYVATDAILKRAVVGIRDELQERLTDLRSANKLLEAQRLEQRTLYDLEMLEQMGFCHGIENYSRWLDGRAAGEAPYTLYDYFPKDLLVFLDESHVTVPQIGAMFRGDRARKETLVEFGFRLPSALDNRPLRFEEWRERVGQVVFVSATPADLRDRAVRGRRHRADHPPDRTHGPAGRDPARIGPGGRPPRRDPDARRGGPSRPRDDADQADGGGAHRLLHAITAVRVRYLHSDIATIERTEIIRELREGAFDVLVGHQPAPRGPRHSGGRASWRSSTRTRRASSARRGR